jgi:hypothetical protein
MQDSRQNILGNTDRSNMTTKIDGQKPLSKIMNSCIDFFRNSIIYEKRADGSQGSILSYNNEYAITIGWLIPRRGSVFSLFESIVLLGVSVMICSLIGYGSCVNFPNAESCISLPDADTSYLTLTTLCSFTIAFFSSIVLDRWWSIRRHLSLLMGSGYDLVIMLAGILTCDVKDATSAEEKKELRLMKHQLMQQIIGLLVLTLRILFNNARGDHDISDLVQRGLITQEEHDYFVSINATTVHSCAMLLNYIQEAARTGLLGQDHGVSEANMLSLQNCVLTIRSNASSVALYIDVQLPYPFIQIISAVTYLFVVQLILVCSAFIGQGLATNNNADITTGVLTICLYNFVLFGLLRLFEVLANPLGDDAADFPGDTYMTKFESLLKLISKSTFAFIDNNGILGSSRPSSVALMTSNGASDFSSLLSVESSKGVELKKL